MEINGKELDKRIKERWKEYEEMEREFADLYGYEIPDNPYHEPISGKELDKHIKERWKEYEEMKKEFADLY